MLASTNCVPSFHRSQAACQHASRLRTWNANRAPPPGRATTHLRDSAFRSYRRRSAPLRARRFHARASHHARRALAYAGGENLPLVGSDRPLVSRHLCSGPALWSTRGSELHRAGRHPAIAKERRMSSSNPRTAPSIPLGYACVAYLQDDGRDAEALERAVLTALAAELTTAGYEPPPSWFIEEGCIEHGVVHVLCTWDEEGDSTSWIEVRPVEGEGWEAVCV